MTCIKKIGFLSLILAKVFWGAIATAQTDGSESVAQPQEVSGWEICNETSFILRVATASIQFGKMSSRGWTTLLPGDCMAVAASKNTPRFVYAESDPVHQGGVREWKGKAQLCGDTNDFVADASRDCEPQGLSTRGYLEIDPSEKRTSLIEPDNFGNKAVNAGIQRLLRDNGFTISRIDGIMGRRTTRNLYSFLKSKELSNKTPNETKITALASAAREIQDGVGLTLCNEAEGRVWTSIAYRDKGGWESRGWWLVQTGACLRPFTETLSGKDLHYYAVLEQNAANTSDTIAATLSDKKLKNIAPVPSQFCVADSQFSAIGRDYCTDKGYRVENFRAVISEEKGQKIILLDSDFTSQNPSGLRR